MIDDIYNKWYYSFNQLCGSGGIGRRTDLGSAPYGVGSSPSLAPTIFAPVGAFFSHLHLFKERVFFYIRKYAIINYQYYCTCNRYV